MAAIAAAVTLGQAVELCTHALSLAGRIGQLLLQLLLFIQGLLGLPQKRQRALIGFRQLALFCLGQAAVADTVDIGVERLDALIEFVCGGVLLGQCPR